MKPRMLIALLLATAAATAAAGNPSQRPAPAANASQRVADNTAPQRAAPADKLPQPPALARTPQSQPAALAPARQQPAQPAAENAEVRYARAQLRIAEINLAQAQRSNQRLAGTVSADIVGEYREAVEVARVELDSALAGNSGDPFAAWLRRAEARSRTSQAEWQNARAANQQVANAVDAFDLERLKARAELMRAEYERGLERASASPEEQTRWQLSQLATDLDRLREESLRNLPTGRTYYYYRSR